MALDLKVPPLGESVTEATVAQWLKHPGDRVAIDEHICTLETDKVSVDVPSPVAGILVDSVVPEGGTVAVNGVLARIAESDAGAGDTAAAQAPSAPRSSPSAAPSEATAPEATGYAPRDSDHAPSARKIIREHGLDSRTITGHGRGGRITKGDALAAAYAAGSPPPTPPMAKDGNGAALVTAAPAERLVPAAAAEPDTPPLVTNRRVTMTRLRRTIAKRLKDAQNTAAILTTYNEVDMSAVIAVRTKYKEEFYKTHGVKLGFMSFFAKACCQALASVPEVNAEIDQTDIVYKDYVHLGIAVGTEAGLVVPIVRHAEQLGFADIERAIHKLGDKARNGQLALEDMQGGTFTISNGGTYGSLLSAPILNPPQSGILGMHTIQERAVVIDQKIVIRPMMYVALSYDHRIVDGKGAVTFLVTVKKALEDPQRLLIGL